MSAKEYAVIIEKLDDDDDYDRCIVLDQLEPGQLEFAESTLSLMVLGPDQEATEYLDRKQFEELVTNARRIMGWT